MQENNYCSKISSKTAFKAIDLDDYIERNIKHLSLIFSLKKGKNNLEYEKNALKEL